MKITPTGQGQKTTRSNMLMKQKAIAKRVNR